MVQNPEEGRISEERMEQLVRDAHRKTAEMRRQYRADRKLKRQIDAKEAWTARHEMAHHDINLEMRITTRRAGKPLNRRMRRAYAKRMNAFKIPQGWQQFSESYKEKFGYQTSIARKKSNSITDAIAQGE